MGDTRSASMPTPLASVIESARLAALRCYSDLPEQDVGGLIRLAHEVAGSLGATHAAVSFVDEDRVWFGGAFGFSGTGARREHSFCDAVVRSAAPLLVPDGRVDPRFWRNELVLSAPGLRCYAGVPLIDLGGYVLGTVAVYSTEPDAFSPSVLRDLAGLAGLVREFLAEARAARAVEPEPVVQGWLGVKTLQTGAGSRRSLPGLVVLGVAKDSPALLAGIRPTDILQSIGGRDLFTSSDVASAMTERVLGSSVRIRFRRAGKWHECDVMVRSRRTRVSGR